MVKKSRWNNGCSIKNNRNCCTCKPYDSSSNIVAYIIYLQLGWLCKFAFDYSNNIRMGGYSNINHNLCGNGVRRMSLIDKEKTMEEIPIDVCDGFEVTDIIEKMPTVKAIPLEKIKQAIEAQEKWLAEAGYNAYNVSIAFESIKHALKK